MEDIKATHEAWYYVLRDYDFGLIVDNLIAYVKSGERFPPSVGQLLPQSQGRAIPNSDETKKLLLALDAPKKDLPTKEELLTIFDQMSEMLKVSKG